MKAILLAAGYATRMYPLTLNTPKALLKIGEKTIIDFIIEKLLEIDVDEIFIVSNEKFYPEFIKWKENSNYSIPIQVFNDQTKSNDDKLGSIGDIDFVLKKTNLFDKFLVINADNLFDFSLIEVFNFFKKKNKCVIGLYDVGWLEEAKKLGVVEIDKNNKLIGFEEKPENPSSTLASTGIYFFPPNIGELIRQYLEEGNNPDKSGKFIDWLYQREPVYGIVFKGKWFDIGSLESFEQAKKEFLNKTSMSEKVVVLDDKEKSGSFFD